jgi:hypothetical protein
VRYINQIEDGLSWLTGRKVFDEKIYYFFEIPTSVSPMMVVISRALVPSVLRCWPASCRLVVQPGCTRFEHCDLSSPGCFPEGFCDC